MIDIDKAIDGLQRHIDSQSRGDACDGCPYNANGVYEGNCTLSLFGDLLKLLKQAKRKQEDENVCIVNLKAALEEEKKLNQQILGRLDMTERIIRLFIKTLVER